MLLLAASATAQLSLTTTFAGGNGQDGCMFDLTAHADITLVSWEYRLFSGGGGGATHTLELYHVTSRTTFVGNETNAGAWTLIGTQTVPTVAAPGAIPVNFGSFTMSSGETIGFYFTEIGVSANSVGYTNGPLGAFVTPELTFENRGVGKSYPFASTYNPRILNCTIFYDLVGPGCVINAPAPGATVAGTTTVNYDATHASNLPVDATFEYSLDAGVTWNMCTGAGGFTNPRVGIATPAPGLTFDWDTVADNLGALVVDTADLRISVDDGSATSSCDVTGLQVDNRPPAPTCTLTGPAGVASGDIDLQVDLASSNSATVDCTFEYSLDGGATWSPCTAGGGSPMPNPAAGMATGPHSFQWASRTDGVGLVSVQAGVLVSVSVDDGVSPIIGTCATNPFDVDNTSLCPGLCGDCDLGGSGPDILDALVAAQIAAVIVVPTLPQTGCCDVDSSGTIDIIDALLMAQAAAQLPVTLTCP